MPERETMKEVEWQVIDRGSLFSAAYRIPLELSMPRLARLAIDVPQHAIGIGIGVAQLPKIPNGIIHAYCGSSFSQHQREPATIAHGFKEWIVAASNTAASDSI